LVPKPVLGSSIVQAVVDGEGDGAFSCANFAGLILVKINYCVACFDVRRNVVRGVEVWQVRSFEMQLNVDRNFS
jgi:hypothetical protein